MPQIVNNFIMKVLRLVREFFQAEFYEYGVLTITPADNEHDLKINTNGNVLRVWFSVQPDDRPYDGHMSHGPCYISQAQPSPTGFFFRVSLQHPCQVSWFAIEESGR